MPALLSNNTAPLTTMRPRLGRARPASRFTSEVLPEPDLPNSARMPSLGAAKATSMEKSPKRRSEEHTSELQSLMRNSYAVFCLKKKNMIKSGNENYYEIRKV